MIRAALPFWALRPCCFLVLLLLLLLRADPTFGRAEQEKRVENAEPSRSNNNSTTTIRLEKVEKEISTAQCVLAVGSSDRNDDQQVDRSEFNQVILELLSGCTVHEETVRDWDEIFRALACLCRDYDDDPASCCDEDAKRAQYGAVVLRPGRYPNEYTYRVCDLLQAAVNTQCFVQVGSGPVSAPIGATTPTPTRSNDDTRSDDSSATKDNDTLYRHIINLVVLLIVLIILLLCLTVCYMRWRHLRRINNDEYDDDNDDDDNNDDDDRGRGRRHRHHRRQATATDDGIDEDSQQAFANTVAKGTFLTTGVDGSEVLVDIETGSRASSSSSSSVDPHNNSSGFPIVGDDDDEVILPSGMIPEEAEGDSETERVGNNDNGSNNNKNDEQLQLVLPQNTSLTDLLPPAFLPTSSSSSNPINNNTITSIEENESGWDDVVDSSSSGTTTSSTDPQYVGDVDMSADENDGDISSAGGAESSTATTDDEREVVVVTDKNKAGGK